MCTNITLVGVETKIKPISQLVNEIMTVGKIFIFDLIPMYGV